MYEPVEESVNEVVSFSVARRVFGALLSEEPVGAGLPQLEGYVLSHQVGRGGGGAVYLGHRRDSDRSLAIKLLDKPLGAGPGAQRAWRELDVLTQLHLPCTPRVHDYGVHEDRMYIATEHIDGPTLAEYCRREGLDRRQRVELLARIADAVQSLHERGVIHRDIKPENILIDASGAPVIIDLGIASLLSDDVTETLTAEGVPLGTPAFMSPEQARGEREAISTRSDVYGLGATACFILTRKTPHDLADCTLLEAVSKVGHEPPRDPRTLDRELPAPLAAILSHALAPRPEDRFATAAELGEDLHRWLQDKPVTSQPLSWWRNRLLSIKRQPGRWASGMAAGVVIVALAVLSAVSAVSAAEAQAAAEWKQNYEQVIAKASRSFVARLRNAEYREALTLLKIVEDHAQAGFLVFENAPEMLAETGHTKNELTVEILNVIHADEDPMTRPELAMTAVKAIYEFDDAWEEPLAADLADLLGAYELGFGR